MSKLIGPDKDVHTRAKACSIQSDGFQAGKALRIVEHAAVQSSIAKHFCL